MITFVRPHQELGGLPESLCNTFDVHDRALSAPPETSPLTCLSDGTQPLVAVSAELSVFRSQAVRL